jgi:DNA-directed RNA polymerase subunit RPC12/RpoP
MNVVLNNHMKNIFSKSQVSKPVQPCVGCCPECNTIMELHGNFPGQQYWLCPKCGHKRYVKKKE